MSNIVKFLGVNFGSQHPILFDKREMDADDPNLKQTILDMLNEMGKQSHVLLKWGNKLYTANHTAARGPSHEYFRDETSYHRYASMLE